MSSNVLSLSKKKREMFDHILETMKRQGKGARVLIATMSQDASENVFKEFMDHLTLMGLKAAHVNMKTLEITLPSDGMIFIKSMLGPDAFKGPQWSEAHIYAHGDFATMLLNMQDIEMGLRLGIRPELHTWNET